MGFEVKYEKPDRIDRTPLALAKKEAFAVAVSVPSFIVGVLMHKAGTVLSHVWWIGSMLQGALYNLSHALTHWVPVIMVVGMLLSWLAIGDWCPFLGDLDKKSGNVIKKKD